MSFRPKKYNFNEALQRLRRYCAYQERSHQEVQKKLWDWGFDKEDSDKVVVQLIEENFLNEERFAKAIAGGKFRTKGWGKNKIVMALKSKGVSQNLVNASLKEIDQADYRKKLKEILEKKDRSVKTEILPVRKQKLARFALGKGYEPDLVWEIIGQMFSE